MTELLVGGALVALSALALRSLRARLDAAAPAGGGGRAEAPAPGPAPARGLRVGDVLLVGGESLWLAGALRFRGPREPADAIALFRAGGTERWVACLDDAARELAVLDPFERLPPGRAPDALRHDGVAYALVFRDRLPVRVEGEDVPRRGPDAEVVLLEGAGGALLVVVDLPRAPRLALAGRRLPEGFAELLPGGDA